MTTAAEPGYQHAGPKGYWLLETPYCGNPENVIVNLTYVGLIQIYDTQPLLPGVDSCNGDSGGPLLYQKDLNSIWYQAGIVSYGTKQCGVGTPGIYTSLPNYMQWIEKNLKP